MNVVAASNLPPHGESPRWFKRLLTRWPKKKDTATSVAAATEKYIRHTSTIQCENLTAKEFAHLTGIDINNTNNDDDNDDDEYNNNNNNSNNNSDDDDNDNRTESSSSLHVHTTIRSSRTTTSCKKPKIWEQDFWQYQTSPLTHTSSSSSACAAPATSSSSSRAAAAMACSSSSSSHYTAFSMSGLSSTNTTLSTCSGHEAFLSQLQRNSTQFSACSTDGARPCSVIQKGRFKIVVGDHPDQDEGQFSVGQEQNDPVIVTPPVLEWKRKRSQEASCPTITLDEVTLCKN